MHGWPCMGWPESHRCHIIPPWLQRQQGALTVKGGHTATLIGNGVHLEAFASWMVFCLCHTICRADHNGEMDDLPAMAMSFTVSSESEEEEKGESVRRRKPGHL